MFFKKERDGKGSYVEHIDRGKEDISIGDLVLYNLLILIPVFISIFASYLLAQRIAQYLQVGVSVATQIILIPLIFMVFFFVIPFIRRRENVKGVRLSLSGFLILSLAMTLPALTQGQWGFLFRQFIFIAEYILLTFIFCPEVLGVSGNMSEWFKKGKQIIILVIYTSIVGFFILGFGWMFYEISLDKTYMASSFAMPNDAGAATPNDMFYYSIITFATIGYGDITPVSNAARLLAGFEAIVGMIMSVLFISILLLYIGSFQAFNVKTEEKELHRVEAAIEEEKKVEKEEKKIEKDMDNMKEYLKEMSEKPRSHTLTHHSTRTTHSKHGDSGLDDLRKKKFESLEK